MTGQGMRSGAAVRGGRLTAALALGLGLGLLLRMGYAWYASARDFIPSHNDAYEMIALSMIQRGEYAIYPGTPTSLREPAYPLFIAGLYALAGGQRPMVVLAAQAALSAASAWLIYLLGCKLFGEAAAKLAFWILIFYPFAVFYSGVFYRETFMAFLFAALAYASSFWADPEGSGDRSALAGGVLAAAFGLAHSGSLPAVGLIGLGLWAAAPPAARWRRAALYFAPVVLGVGAWGARNCAVQGIFIPGSTMSGLGFYQALVVPPDDLGTDRQGEILQADPDWRRYANLPEVESNAGLLAASSRFIRRHPGLYLTRVAKGIAKFWRLWPHRRQYPHSYFLLAAASLLSDGWIVPLGFWGLWLFRSRWREAPAIPAGIAGVTVAYGMVHALMRFRLPLMGCMILLAASALVGRRGGGTAS